MRKKEKKPTMATIEQLIEANLHDETFTVKRLAEELFFKSREQLYRIVKREKSLSPSAFITQKRLDRAKNLLETSPKMKVTEVASACGFKEASYFGRAFKRHFGHTPGDFKGIA
jgi:AraC-like DNA-binding protein